MSHELGTIRISQQGKDQLIKLKRATGIKNWNTLCRWAHCISLNDAGKPAPRDPVDSNVEMSWRTFAGSERDALDALVRMRAAIDGEPEQAVLDAHIHRGIGRLASLISRDGTIEDLVVATA